MTTPGRPEREEPLQVPAPEEEPVHEPSPEKPEKVPA